MLVVELIADLRAPRSDSHPYQQYPKLHLQAYGDKWVFRFDRQVSRTGTLLRLMLFFRLMELAVLADPLPYDTLAKSKRPRRALPKLPRGGGAPRPSRLNDNPAPGVRRQ